MNQNLYIASETRIFTEQVEKVEEYIINTSYRVSYNYRINWNSNFRMIIDVHIVL